MNILIAEDTPFLQVFNRELMKVWNFDFDMVSDGVEVVKFARKNAGKYDLCLMDVEMPGMTGIEATRIIRKTVKYFPILGYTSGANYREECLEAGMDDFAVKPCTRAELLSKIKELTIKSIRCLLQDSKILLKEEMPVDKKHAEELRELAKENLRKVTFFDAPGRALIVHKNILNRISHDFNIKGQLVSTFINRDPEKPTLCHLYKESNYLMPQVFLLDDEYDVLVGEEDADLDNYPELILKEEEAKY